MDEKLELNTRSLRAVHRPWPVRWAFAALLALGCESTAMPGTALGTYSVTGTLSANTCGATLDPPDPWTFSVDLSKEGSTLYWNWNDGSTYISGLLDEDLSATIEATVAGAASSADGGVSSSCSMQRRDVLDVKLAEGDVPASFDGGLSYTFSALSGADCSDQLTASGGEYQTLPCTVSYTFAATRK